MIAPNDILERRNEIKHFVATAKLDLAVKRCIDFYQDFNNNNDDDAVLLSTSFYMILQQEKNGLITMEFAMVEKQKIARRILQLIRDLIENLPLAA